MAPDLALAITFALAWWAPHAPGALKPDESRLIMLLEGFSIIASALAFGAGLYVVISLIYLPLILVGFVVWLVMMGTVELSSMFAFIWFVLAAFVDGILAHRGHFGSARENPAHPQRRFDRLFILYFATALTLPAIWVTSNPLQWTVWGTIYFTLLFVSDTVLPRQFDRIPQSMLRWLKNRVRPEVAPKIGICIDCIHVQPAVPSRPGRLVRCGLSITDTRFLEYPATPVNACEGFRAQGRLRKEQRT